MSSRLKKFNRRFLIVMMLTIGVPQLTAASYGLSYNLRCLITLVRHCYSEFGFTWAALNCVREGTVACQATQ